MVIEIAANSLQSAINAQLGGATRIELCSDLELGGITPSAGLIRKVRSALHIPIYVLIRPRAGDFIYSDFEFETMLADIEFCKSENIDGIVTGVLDNNAKIDKERLLLIKEVAGAMPVTFNRAFDVTASSEEAIQTLIECGVERVLTSGQKSSAIDGRFLIKQLADKVGKKIIIMAGSGINENNILPISEFTGVNEFHTSSKILVKSQMVHLHRDIKISSNNDNHENDYYISDLQKIKKVVNALSPII